MKQDFQDRDVFNLLGKGYSVRKIAKCLNCDHTVILRRLKGTEEYIDYIANKEADKIVLGVKRLVKICNSVGKGKSRAGAPKGVGRPKKVSWRP